MNPQPLDAPLRDSPVHLFTNFAVATCNLAGWNSVLGPERTQARSRLPRYSYAFKMFKRHHLSVVGVLEHHLPDAAALKTAAINLLVYLHLNSSHGFACFINLLGSWSPPLCCCVVYSVLF